MIKNLTTLLLIVFISCGQTTGKQEAKIAQKNISNWKTLKESNYSIQYPDNWDLNQVGQMGTKFILFSQLDSSNDNFRENVNLIIQDLSGKNIDLDKYVEITEGQVKTMISNSSLIESKREKNNNGEFHKMVYTGDQGVFHLTFEQYFWVINDKAYVLTFTSEQNKFSSYKSIGEQILNSFLLSK